MRDFEQGVGGRSCRGSCRSPNGGRWWRGEERGGRGVTWRSRRAREKTKAGRPVPDPKLVEWAGWSGGEGLKGKRRGRGGKRRSQILGRVGRRARKLLGQQRAEMEIPQGLNRAHLHRRFP